MCFAPHVSQPLLDNCALPCLHLVDKECDHCETSERAYADIVPLLAALAREIGKNPEELTIYDPYYCQGSTVARLTSLGFPNVYNRKEDFYQVKANGSMRRVCSCFPA